MYKPVLLHVPCCCLRALLLPPPECALSSPGVELTVQYQVYGSLAQPVPLNICAQFPCADKFCTKGGHAT